MDAYLDIETIPAQSDAAKQDIADQAQEEKEAVRAPSNYKDEAKISEYIAARRAEIDASSEERWRKTSFDGFAGQIVCISVAYDDDTPKTFWREDWSVAEADILKAAFASLTDAGYRYANRLPTFVGHNIVDFDIPFIWKRAIVLGIKPPQIFPRMGTKSWSERVFDTMTQAVGYGNRISMDRLCKVLGIPGKPDGIDGSKVWDFVREGNVSKVAEYCAGDVERTRQIHKRLTFGGQV
jgi:predicted PolB exonuclease-like 3'-5' exonuclease